MIKVIELGPFGSRIDRGLAEDLDDIPEGYVVKWAEASEDDVTRVIIEPHGRQEDR